MRGTDRGLDLLCARFCRLAYWRVPAIVRLLYVPLLEFHAAEGSDGSRNGGSLTMKLDMSQEDSSSDAYWVAMREVLTCERLFRVHVN